MVCYTQSHLLRKLNEGIPYGEIRIEKVCTSLRACATLAVMTARCTAASSWSGALRAATPFVLAAARAAAAAAAAASARSLASVAEMFAACRSAVQKASPKKSRIEYGQLCLRVQDMMRR